MDKSAELRAIIEQTKALLTEHWPDGVALADPRLLQVRTPAVAPRFQTRRDAATAPLSPPPPGDAGDGWTALEQQVKACRRCPLAQTRTQTVFGNGHPRARVMFVGEAPGRDEDEQGAVFVGEAGQLLTKILGAIGFKREEVYIANVLKCRPPGNRDPHPDEITQCREYLVAQIDLVRPAVICALGRVAAQTLLETATGIMVLRKTTHQFRGLPLVATLHPSALLRNPGWKQLAWADVQRLRALYDQAVGRPRG